MGRIRSIKPTIPQDRKLAGLSRDARLTFLYLISQADDQGLVPGEPRQLLGVLFPHDEDVTERKLSRWLTELSDTELIAWHRTRDGMRVVRLVGWHKHQQVKNPGKPVLLEQLADAPSELRPRSTRKPTENVPSAGFVLPPIFPQSSGDSTEDVVRPSVESGGAEEGKKGRREEGKGKKGSLAPDCAQPTRDPDPKPPASWPGRLAQVWTQHIGLVDPGRLGKALKPFVAQHGEALLARAIAHYGRTLLDEGRTRFASPEDFGRTAAQWIDDARPIGETVIGGGA